MEGCLHYDISRPHSSAKFSVIYSLNVFGYQKATRTWSLLMFSPSLRTWCLSKCVQTSFVIKLRDCGHSLASGHSAFSRRSATQIAGTPAATSWMLHVHHCKVRPPWTYDTVILQVAFRDGIISHQPCPSLTLLGVRSRCSCIGMPHWQVRTFNPASKSMSTSVSSAAPGSPQMLVGQGGSTTLSSIHRSERCLALSFPVGLGLA